MSAQCTNKLAANKPVCLYSCSAMLRPMNKPGNRQAESSLRMSAGNLKGRQVNFSAPGIRPTGDRVRETLFNWLGARVTDAQCLDLFAGTGALGIEALSRGAQRVIFVEQQAEAASQIKRNLDNFGSADGKVLQADAYRVDMAALGPFDIVFLDPPFESPELSDLCKLLESSDCLAADALIYIEVAKKPGLPDLPDEWRVLREKTAGQVRFALLQRAHGDVTQE